MTLVNCECSKYVLVLHISTYIHTAEQLTSGLDRSDSSQLSTASIGNADQQMWAFFKKKKKYLGGQHNATIYPGVDIPSNLVDS